MQYFSILQLPQHYEPCALINKSNTEIITYAPLTRKIELPKKRTYAQPPFVLDKQIERPVLILHRNMILVNICGILRLLCFDKMDTIHTRVAFTFLLSDTALDQVAEFNDGAHRTREAEIATARSKGLGGRKIDSQSGR